MPLSEIVTDFFDQLKSRTSGFASFECVYLLLHFQSGLDRAIFVSYEDAGYQKSDLAKVRRPRASVQTSTYVSSLDGFLAEWQACRCPCPGRT